MGGTVGGPIKRDKMFFFFSYQSTNQINGNAGNIINDVYPLLPRVTAATPGSYASSWEQSTAGRRALCQCRDGRTRRIEHQSGCAGADPGQVLERCVCAAILPVRGRHPHWPDGYRVRALLLAPLTRRAIHGNVDYKLTPARPSLRNTSIPTLSSKQSTVYPWVLFVTTGHQRECQHHPHFTVTPTLVNEVKLGFMRQYGGTTNTNSGLTATQIGMKAAPDAAGAFPQFLIALDVSFSQQFCCLRSPVGKPVLDQRHSI